MIVSDRDLVLHSGLRITPTDESLIQPASIDLRLGMGFKTMEYCDDSGPIDPATTEIGYWSHHLPPSGQAFELDAGGFVLASTYEAVAFPDNLAGQVIDKSSLARLGLGLHAGFIDPGFEGHITLEITNHAPRSILLWPGMLIGQLVIFQTTSNAARPYGSNGLQSRYQDQEAMPVASRSAQNFRKGLGCP